MFHKDKNIPRAEIVVIGNEVTSGMIQETNSRTISRQLISFGIDVTRVTQVGDDEEDIADAVKQSLKRVEVVITTGGLGSTHDDITKKVLARVFGCGFKHDDRVHAMLKKIFKARGKSVPESVLEQCRVPDKATILYNEKGTAPGLLFEKGGKKVFALPGIPLEMEHLFEKYVLPEVSTLGTMRIDHRIVRTTGISEAGLWEKFGPVEALEPFVQVASLPSHLGVKVRFSASGKTPEEIAEKLDQAEQILRSKVSDFIFGVDEETLEGKVGELLSKNKLTLAVAESCTGGLIGHRLTQIAGSSKYFLEDAVTYSNEAKRNRLGVPEDLLSEHGAVSSEVALAMAEGIRKTSGSDYGLSVTGIAGPDGGSEEKPVGLTFIAVSGPKGSECEKFLFHQDRQRNKDRAAQAALNLLRLNILKHCE